MSGFDISMCEYSLNVSRPRKIRRVPDKMQDHVGEESQPGEPDEKLGPDGGGKHADERFDIDGSDPMNSTAGDLREHILRREI